LYYKNAVNARKIYDRLGWHHQHTLPGGNDDFCARKSSWAQDAGGIRYLSLDQKCAIGFIKRRTDAGDSTLMSTEGSFDCHAHRQVRTNTTRLTLGHSRLQTERMHLNERRNGRAGSDILADIRVSLPDHS